MSNNLKSAQCEAVLDKQNKFCGGVWIGQYTVTVQCPSGHSLSAIKHAQRTGYFFGDCLIENSHEMKTLCEAENHFSNSILHIFSVCISPTWIKRKFCDRDLDILRIVKFHPALLGSNWSQNLSCWAIIPGFTAIILAHALQRSGCVLCFLCYLHANNKNSHNLKKTCKIILK